MKLPLSLLLMVSSLYLNADTINKPLKKGWNLVGAVSEKNISDISCAKSIWAWNEIEKNWALYQTIDSSNNFGYEKLNAIAQGKGFWINANNECNLSLENANINDKIDINAGWNLLGAIENLDVSNFSNVSSIWTYDNEDWLLYQTINSTINFGLEKLTTINKGSGFWVNSENGTTVDYTNSLDDLNVSNKLYEVNFDGIDIPLTQIMQ